MKLQQLRYLCAVADHQLNVSDAAKALHTSQPGVSKQIRLLEDELGVPIFNRSGKRLVEITEAGHHVLDGARQVLHEIENIQCIGLEYTRETEGMLTIATTHTQARYVLPPVIKRFRSHYPNVRMHIHQGNPTQISEMVATGEADVAIATEAVSVSEGLVALPCYQWNRCVLVPLDHALLAKEEPLSLADLTEHPIVTYDYAFAGRSLVNKAFTEAGLQPNVVLTALDSDVIKTYVEEGLGIGLVAKMAFDPQRDRGLQMIDVAHLFEDSTTWIGIRRGNFLRGYIYDFIELFAPHLNRAKVKIAMLTPASSTSGSSAIKGV